MKKFILGLTSCIALVACTCLFSGCNKNDKALAKVTNEWSAIKNNKYVGSDGIVDHDVIFNTEGVKEYYSTFGDNKNYGYTLPMQPYFLKNVMAPLAGINTIGKATYKDKLTNKQLNKLADELKDLNQALNDYTSYVDGMDKTIKANSTLIYGDLFMYESLASIVISEAFDAVDIYIDMIYNTALDCNIPKNTTKISGEVATTITHKLSNEIAHSFYSIYYDLTGFDALRLADKKSPGIFTLNYFETYTIPTYTEAVTNAEKLEAIIDMQEQIIIAETAKTIIEDITEGFDYETFKLNFQNHYAKDASFSDTNSDGIYLQEECIKKYSSPKDYTMYKSLSNLISVDLNLALRSLTSI